MTRKTSNYIKWLVDDTGGQGGNTGKFMLITFNEFLKP